jgi:hypothetical protein
MVAPIEKAIATPTSASIRIRRQSHSRSGPRAHRGAAQGPREEGACDGRRSAHRHPPGARDGNDRLKKMSMATRSPRTTRSAPSTTSRS